MNGKQYLLATGALLGVYISSAPFIWFCVAIAAYTTLLIRCMIPYYFLLLALLLCTLFYMYTPFVTPQPLTSWNKEISLEGRVISHPSVEKERVQIQIQEKEGDKWLGLVQTEDVSKDLKIGATCHVSGIVEEPIVSRNPGGFHYSNFLRTSGIQGRISIQKQDIVCQGSSPRHFIHEVREGIIQELQRTYSTSTAGWVMTLLLGEDRYLEEETVELFRRWNLSHLLAISGLHVGLCIAIFSFICLRAGMLSKEWLKGLLLVILPIYVILAGGAPSVMRAASMAEAAILLSFLRLRISIVDVLSLLVVGFLLVNPLLAFNIGFQFSFLVTFSLLFSPKLFHHVSPVTVLLRISLISQLILLPLQVLYFYVLNPVSLFANVFIVPLFSFIIIPFCLLLLVMLLFPIQLALWLDTLFRYVIDFTVSMVDYMDQYVLLEWVLGEMGLLFIIMYYVLFLTFMRCWENEYLLKSLWYGVLMVSILMFHSSLPYLSSEGKVTMLDIGQGDTFILEWPHRKHIMLIDAAGKVFSDKEEIFMYNIMPYLHSRGIQKVDSMLISHKDHDHMGSMEEVLKQFHVDTILVSPYYEWDTGDAAGVRSIHRLKRGDEFTIENQLFEVLNPDNEQGDKNDNSLVVYTHMGGKGWLFTGDISTPIEEEIMTLYPDKQVDVLKVAHHGSKTSSSSVFVNHYMPAAAWISVGKMNRYGHPHPTIIATYEDRGIPIYRTDKHGAVSYTFSNNTGTFHTFLP
ncbi:DNA internalization-related competence protein ComEC/Rec2 [Pontibacillus salicampi]|uniref:DNA internalization-related competence protein ComEC/Rec2 n=1 Tax=Pontibacillus salicampi TaxID=1449801 RepID=A0ABV6LJM3_9BACI